MTRIVCKFGGTSVADPARIGRAADRIAAARRGGAAQVVAVISAMGRTTDDLLGLARDAAPSAGRRPSRELDLLLATGEQAAAALLALALEERGVSARALTGAQAGIDTDAVFGDARIAAVRRHAIERALEAGVVPVVAGFQGAGPSGDVTTLGRGGSDTTAVALAVALGAASCDIHTDVDGIFTADPRKVADARRHDRLSHREALLLARAGAAVLHPRAAALAAERRLPLRILSSAGPWPGPERRNGGPPDEPPRGGTRIEAEAAAALERGRLLGVVAGAPVRPIEIDAAGEAACAAAILERLQAEGIAFARVQAAGQDGRVSVLLDEATAAAALRVLNGSGSGGGPARAQAPYAPVTVVETGRHPDGNGPAALLRALAEAGIAPRGVAFTEPGVTVHVEPGAADRAVEILHRELFAGGRPAARRHAGARGHGRAEPARGRDAPVAAQAPGNGR